MAPAEVILDAPGEGVDAAADVSSAMGRSSQVPLRAFVPRGPGMAPLLRQNRAPKVGSPTFDGNNPVKFAELTAVTRCPMVDCGHARPLSPEYIPTAAGSR
ncbi:hypothetical protein GS4_25_00580 [Gordonia soli NBRC 108243]|uniref:Uncharacterized protein n=1 Tax=Gordonia soli NBRC 108243 TaxID=1223545 RepID=M0QPW9_9ACTN|nr:hypothetical protein GS4_25_00580 [Gordonia soli NBRC 108243]